MSPMPDFNDAAQPAIQSNTMTNMIIDKTATDFEIIDDNQIITNNTDLLFDEILVDENQCNTDDGYTKSPTLSGLIAGKRLDKNSLPRDASVDTLAGKKMIETTTKKDT